MLLIHDAESVHYPMEHGSDMPLDQAMKQLRQRCERVPKPLHLPTEAEVKNVEDKLGVRFHPDYRKYLLEASDVVFGTIEPATITRPDSHTHLPTICNDAWTCGVSKEFLPICEDNGDYYCLTTKGEVVFLSHNGFSSEKWPDLAAWIEQVWLGESA